MKSLLLLILGAVIGFGVHWYVTRQSAESVPAHARENRAEVVQTLKDTLNTEAIREELSRSGQVIREKARQAGRVISDAADNARITATIKTKLLREAALSALAIDVDTTDGVVTLSGSVSSYEQIAQAMRLAMDTEGVTKVISTLQVKAAE